jgi:hypothetical protein
MVKPRNEQDQEKQTRRAKLKRIPLKTEELLQK